MDPQILGHIHSALADQRRLMDDVCRGLTVEIRTKVWRYVGHGSATVTREDTHHEREPLRAFHVSSDDIRSVAVDQLGDNKFFRLLENVPPVVIQEFIQEASADLTFTFDSTQSFEGFLSRIEDVARDNSFTIPRLRVQVPLFDGDDFQNMDEWQLQDEPHGGYLKARRHVIRVVENIRRLPTDSIVVLRLLQPWRDYRFLRFHTSPLRDHQRSYTIRVSIDMTRWHAVPNSDFHICSTIAAVARGGMAEQAEALSDADTKRLLKYGCRGFRILS
ncbi:hypothetical protein F5X68DRAFT_244841 [Plectosphaerella plurivora]|uniref:Uncharacterized protein n=1 Tax=Plectosphaerella plurivora TaxID=936078 RepID=A0A9P9A655_9PEZI|nr:hypothetical protein F5X68DRAFT_244841 [Plectosphaerella plurivora]